jgi:DnaJ like chaperone protein
MSQNHPDKLVSRGLPKEMLAMATKKTKAIQKAYELIERARRLN